MNSVLQKDIEYFIEDFEQKSQIELIEGKEKVELERIALARGMRIRGSRDLAIFKTIYGFTNRPNSNGAILPQKELLKVLPQLIGKPISVNHNRKHVVGHYIDYKYIQKDNMIIAYGVFYKSNFDELWNQAKYKFKKKELSTSFEIWSPKSARKENLDGSYELHQIEIAGGALIFHDEDNFPAFEGADVLAIAKKMADNPSDLIYASRHKESEIIGSNQWENSIEEQKVKREAEVAEEAIVPTIPKVKCRSCEEEFETTEQVDIKCPKCFSILNNQGEVKYPPQIVDFSVACLNCQSRNWLILADKEDSSDLRCKDCSKEFTVKFSKPQKQDDIASKIKFLYTGQVSCIQCGNRILISGTSGQTEHEVHCKKCGITFPVDTAKLDRKRNIETIQEVDIEGRRKEQMKKEDETKKKVEDEKKVDEQVIETPKEEDKVAEPKAEENKEVAPKAEAPAEEKVTKSSEDKSKQVEGEVPVSTDSITVNAEDTPATPEISSDDSTQTPQEAPKSEDSSSKEPKEETQDETPETPSEEKEIKTPEKSSVDNKVAKYEKAISKLVDKVTKLKKANKLEVASVTATADKSKEDEIAKIKNEADKKIGFYKDNAQLIVSRKTELGPEYSQDISDKDIVNDDVFEKVKLEKANALLRAEAENTTDNVGVKTSGGRDEDFYTAKRKEIDDEAFGNDNSQ